ncbi:MAG: response regulator PleD [Candidatus Syntrophoarchaeum sp. GoM_oil]|nr:MAG: response regulator PleD [Candidatus Syntrophoarchaeum sp. GoM_oil]
MSDILIVDDNEDIRELFTLILEDEDYNVIGVESGEDAIALLENGEKFKLILMDVTLGCGMCGLDTTEKIKSNPAWRDIPMIAVTGLTLPEDEEKAKAKGCTGFLKKPVDDEELIRVANKFICL